VLTVPVARGFNQAAGQRARSDIKINVTAFPGAAAMQWINTWTGERVDATLDRPWVYQLTRLAAFGAAPAVLIVRTRS
jgi:hypothetical protein